MIHLDDIPGQFKDDPTSGIQEILKHYPGGSTWQCKASGETSRVWVHTIYTPSPPTLVPVCTAVYEEPRQMVMETHGQWMSRKERAIILFLQALVHQAKQYLSLTGEAPPAPPSNTLKDILREARVTPQEPETRSAVGDALLAKIQANRGAVPAPSPAPDPAYNPMATHTTVSSALCLHRAWITGETCIVCFPIMSPNRIYSRLGMRSRNTINNQEAPTGIP